MNAIVEVPTNSGETVLVEIRDASPQERPAGAAAILGKSPHTLETLLSHLRPLARAARDALADTEPDSLTLEVGVALTLEGSVFFAAASTEGNFKVAMTWQRKATLTNGD